MRKQQDQTQLKDHMKNHRKWTMSQDLKTMKYLISIMFIFLLNFASSAHSVEWNDVDAKQRKVLAPFKERWTSIDAKQQKKLIAAARKWQTLSNEQKKGAAARFKNWQKLTPNERSAIKKRWKQFKSLSTKERLKIRKQYQRYKKLNPQKQQELRTRWQTLSEDKKKQILERLKKQRERMNNTGGSESGR